MGKNGDSAVPAVLLDQKGVRLPWKVLFIAVGILAGGGLGTYGFQSLFVQNASVQDVEKIEAKNAQEHEDFRGGIAQCQKVTMENAEAIKVVTATVGKIESTQVRDIARKEARRLTDGLRNRRQAEMEYDRLFEQNLRRMSRGLDPCGSLVCE